MADENENKSSQPQSLKDQPNNEIAWIILIALLICLLLGSGYGLTIIYQAFVDLLTSSTGSLRLPNPPF